jgi:hypothetical protein
VKRITHIDLTEKQAAALWRFGLRGLGSLNRLVFEEGFHELLRDLGVSREVTGGALLEAVQRHKPWEAK